MNCRNILLIFLLLICSPFWILSAQASNPFGSPEPSSSDPKLPPNIDLFKIHTGSWDNPEIPFYVRIPKNFDPNNKDKVHRILFMCPYVNHDGLIAITGGEKNQEVLDMADAQDWFVVTPTFKQGRAEVHDRKTSYYYPEEFSGKAVLEALDQIAQKYPVDINHLLLQGLSGGAQFTHRFALWAPDRVTAIAINSCSWFDDPNPKCNQIAWLVTIGESDPSFNNTLDFIEKLRDTGATPLFRSYIAMIHEGDKRVAHLDAVFLKFYDDLTHVALGRQQSVLQSQEPFLALSGKEMPFVGDNQTWKFLPNTEDNRDKIDDDSRVFIPSQTIAAIWGNVDDEK